MNHSRVIARSVTEPACIIHMNFRLGGLVTRPKVFPDRNTLGTGDQLGLVAHETVKNSQFLPAVFYLPRECPVSLSL